MITKEDIKLFHDAHRTLMQADDFIYLLPDIALQRWISNYTITFPSNNTIADNYTVMPHGSATLVFSYNRDGIYGNLFGPSTVPSMVGDKANQSEMIFIIEFHPAGLYAFTGIDQKELTNQRIPFEVIKPILNRSMIEILERTNNLSELISGIETLLGSNCLIDHPSQLNIATKMIIEHAGNISRKEISDSVYYSERHINRIFDQCMGMNIKTFSRMVRINKAMRLMHDDQNSIIQIANLTGFYDLPHFTHDFKSVCGITPKEYRNNMSDYYNEIAKF